MCQDLSNWTPRPRPERTTIEGRYVALEPLDVDKHGKELFDASDVSDADQKFPWLAEQPPRDEASFLGWVGQAAQSADPMFYAVIERKTGKVAGQQALMRVDAQNGVIEVGNIYWGPLMAHQRGATEALFLFMKHIFDDLGYRRFEWKCNNENEPSKRAALRFGFSYEGLFRQHLIVKGLNRDTAWYSIIDKDWPVLKAGYEAWLLAENFHEDGQQIRRLEECLSSARGRQEEL